MLRVVVLIVVAGCGARTELSGGHENDAEVDVHVGLDASHDAADASDAIVDDAPSTCGDTQNAQSPPAPPNTCNQGATWIAWQYIPASSFTTGAIELFTNDGTLALLDGSGSQPGAILATGTLVPQGPPTMWKTASLSQPVALVAGHRYFIAENVESCSIATTGTQYTYFGGGSLSGPWSGPFEAWAFTSRIDCAH